MHWYCYVAWTAIVLQLVFLVQIVRNYYYAGAKYKKERTTYRPRAVLIVPCKGLDHGFKENISSLFDQDYEDYLLWFVVATESDPALAKLKELKSRLSQTSKAKDVQIFIAGQARTNSQKIHNLLHCYHKISDDIEVLAFADSDVRVRPDWLSQIVYPLRKSKVGAASGYRWFIPKRNNVASLALSGINAKIAQLLGDTRFNQVWGGSMAIRVDVFRKLGLDKIWSNALSDDLSLSTAVKKAGLKVAFVPACLVASYQHTTWRELFEFGRRQFLITRVSAPGTWWFGFLSCLCSILGLWGGAAVAIYAAVNKYPDARLFAAVPVLFFISPVVRALLRQRMIGKILQSEFHQMKPAMVADVLLFWLWSLLLLLFILSSAVGRTIVWRGITYKLLGPTQTVVLARNTGPEIEEAYT